MLRVVVIVVVVVVVVMLGLIPYFGKCNCFSGLVEERGFGVIFRKILLGSIIGRHMGMRLIFLCRQPQIST